jgi:hypothetical protein
MALILATIQPSFLPWLGYLEQMDVADVFVYLDDVKYTRQDWRNRNRFLNQSGAVEYVTVPVQANSDRLLINQVKIATDDSWEKKAIKKISAWYAKAPYKRKYLLAIQEIFSRRHEKLQALNIDLMDLLRSEFSITTPIYYSSEAEIQATDKNQRLIDLCKHFNASVLYDGAAAANFIDERQFRDAGISVVFQNYRPEAYPQSGEGFVSHLSAMDCLMWCGEGARDVLRKSSLPPALAALGD